jgi:hypothetical protein
MKKENILRKILFAIAVPAIILACDKEDEPAAISVDFATVATTTQESDGSTITIPLRKANSISDLSVEFGGTATEGEDFTFVGLTAEGVQISIIDDADAEFDEIIRVLLTSSRVSLTGNNIHNVTIINNCQDKNKPFTQFFRGHYLATEKYGPTPATDWYGPYDLELEPDPKGNPNILVMHNFYDSGREAYLQFDPATGKVWFPDQKPLPDTNVNRKITGSTGTFSIDECNHTTLTVTLNYDGGVWEYYFEKQ